MKKVRYTLACRNEDCFLGGGWWSDIPHVGCPHCHQLMTIVGAVTTIDLFPAPPVGRTRFKP